MKPRKFNVLYDEFMDELDLDLVDACLGDAIYYSSYVGNPFYNITREELAELVHISISTLFRRIKNMKKQGLIEQESRGTAWRTSELWNKTYEKYRDKYHPKGFDDTVDTIGNWYVNDGVAN